MRQRPYACFGYVFLANMFDAGEVFYAKKDVNSVDTLLTVEGFLEIYDKDTDELVEEISPGWFAAPYRDVHHRITALTDATVFCFSSALNRGFIPALEPVMLSAGETQDLQDNTKLFLCRGTVTVNEKDITGPCQIAVQKAKPITAKDDVYGVIIK